MIQINRRRVYWILCAMLVVAGLFSTAFANTYAHNEGEMPPEFAVATWVMLLNLGLMAAVLGLVWAVARKFLSRS